MKKEVRNSNLKYSYEVPFLTDRIKLEAGEYKVGELVEFDYSTKVGKKITAAEKIYGIVCQDVTIDSTTTHTEVYLQGIFNKNEIVGGAISDLETVKEASRKINIFFK